MKTMKTIIQNLIILINIYNVLCDEVSVEVEQGTLLGTEETLVTNDGTYYSFKGIPYAQAPVGTLRFKDPLPPLEWTGTRNATEHGAVCPQVDIITNEYIPGDEDCLFLNVYSPNLNGSLPVIFFIHGGAFKSGSGNSDLYGPDFLIRKDMVVVTINYRLGVLGFLCTNTKDVPGNAGLKDQLAALKWVNKNIEKFGGNSSRVTIFGHSAGAASAAYHTISPLSKGYFERAIVASGSPYNDWSTPFKPVKRAYLLGQILGYETTNATLLLSYLQNATKEELVKANATLFYAENIYNIPIKTCLFTPVQEQDHGQEMFLSEEPVKLLNSGKVNEVDIMFGYTDQEALYVLKGIEESYLSLYGRYPENLVPYKILIKNYPDIIINLSEQIQEYFFGSESINSTSSVKAMVEYISNSSVEYDLQTFARDFPNPGNNSRYFYKFSCYSERNTYGLTGATYGIYGAAHTEELHYLFNPTVYNFTLETNTTAYEMVELATTVFTDFAKYGNPTPSNSTVNVTWPQFDNQKLTYVDINSTLTVAYSPDDADMRFWRKIYAISDHPSSYPIND